MNLSMVRFNINENQQGEVLLALEGYIEAEAVSLLEKHCRNVLEVGRRLKLDFAEVKFVDSAGARMFRRVMRLAPVTIVNCPNLIRGVLFE
jgi:anti-anti-sigma regulatory factor